MLSALVFYILESNEEPVTPPSVTIFSTTPPNRPPTSKVAWSIFSTFDHTHKTQHVGGKLYSLNTFPASESIFKMFLGSYGHFFDETTPKSNILLFWWHFIKEVAVAAEERLKNTF